MFTTTYQLVSLEYHSPSSVTSRLDWLAFTSRSLVLAIPRRQRQLLELFCWIQKQRDLYRIRCWWRQQQQEGGLASDSMSFPAHQCSIFRWICWWFCCLYWRRCGQTGTGLRESSQQSTILRMCSGCFLTTVAMEVCILLMTNSLLTAGLIQVLWLSMIGRSSVPFGNVWTKIRKKSIASSQHQGITMNKTSLNSVQTWSTCSTCISLFMNNLSCMRAFKLVFQNMLMSLLMCPFQRLQCNNRRIG